MLRAILPGKPFYSAQQTLIREALPMLPESAAPAKEPTHSEDKRHKQKTAP
ncbi:hypothetical protein ATPR_2411 [Acetobacter tropicalis NBRC 101654]|uniref:Uncharacterized protein n=1 Tax=Acetobacter tropicalis NBRC 101654 TaxID=749388 RepID=F7VGB2_9PROT|nr:hypothetical protein ATPR_2411 [Acetobacter tropicalis NBRC 101654]